MSNHSNIAFIGAGNMGSSLIAGLINDGFPPEYIFISDPDIAKLKTLQNTFPGMHVSLDNHETIMTAKTIVFAVKPQQMKTMIIELATTIKNEKPLMISIAAGTRINSIQQWLNDQDSAIVRCMPNTPALIRCGATGLFANAHVSAEQKDLAESIMRAVGITVWVNQEEDLDIITALSGSGPAYFFLLMEALATAATRLGLNAEVARLLTLQTGYGATRMALESNHDLNELRYNVTSPGGTTAAAIQVLQDGNLQELLAEALNAARKRADELSRLA